MARRAASVRRVHREVSAAVRRDRAAAVWFPFRFGWVGWFRGSSDGPDEHRCARRGGRRHVDQKFRKKQCWVGGATTRSAPRPEGSTRSGRREERYVPPPTYGGSSGSSSSGNSGGNSGGGRSSTPAPSSPPSSPPPAAVGVHRRIPATVAAGAADIPTRTLWTSIG